MKRFDLLLYLLIAAGVSEAQTRSPAQATVPPSQAQGQAHAAAPARPAVNVIAPSALYDAALRMARAIDAGQAVQLWDGASAVTKRAVKRDAFVDGVAKSRRSMAVVAGRDWISIHRQNSTGGTRSAGQYASVEFATALADRRVVREMVSFRLDEDGIWRFSGYVIK